MKVLQFTFLFFIVWILSIAIVMSALYLFELNKMIILFIMPGLFNSTVVDVISFIITGLAMFNIHQLYQICFGEKND